MEHALMAIDLHPSDAQNLFKILDPAQTGSVDLLEFVQACVNDRGAARSLDLRVFMHDFVLHQQLHRDILMDLSDRMSKLCTSSTHRSEGPDKFRTRDEELAVAA